MNDSLYTTAVKSVGKSMHTIRDMGDDLLFKDKTKKENQRNRRKKKKRKSNNYAKMKKYFCLLATYL